MIEIIERMCGNYRNLICFNRRYRNRLIKRTNHRPTDPLTHRPTIQPANATSQPIEENNGTMMNQLDILPAEKEIKKIVQQPNPLIVS